MTRRGFTLLEMMVVVAILGLVASAATLRAGGAYRRAQFKHAATSIVSFDSRLRRHARLSGTPMELRIEPDSNRLEATPTAGDPTAQLLLSLPKTVSVARALTRREDSKRSVVMARFDREGRGDSYALLLTMPSGAERWLLFAGASGQLIEINEERQAKELMRALAKNRFNTD